MANAGSGLTQVSAASLLGVSQPYLSLLEKGARPLTTELRNRMKTSAGRDPRGSSDDLFRAQLSALGYPAFAHVAKVRTRTRPDNLLMAVLSKPDADARVVEALPWLVATFERLFGFGSMVRQAKLQNLHNRLESCVWREFQTAFSDSLRRGDEVRSPGNFTKDMLEDQEIWHGRSYLRSSLVPHRARRTVW